MHHLNKYIKENSIKDSNNLAEKLLQEFSVKCRVESDQGGQNLYTFKYDQLNSPKGEGVVQECRGIVLDESLNLVFKGFDRFFNSGEMLEITANFCWDNFEAFEKADGSLIKAYYHKGYWQVGTNGTALGEVSMHTDGWDGTDGKLFRNEVIKCFGYSDEDDFQNNAHLAFFDHLNYVFEFTSPENRIVTPYEYDQMVLLSVFENGEELHWDTVNEELQDMLLEGLNVRLANRYEVDSKEGLCKMVDNLEGLQEGFVLRDINGMRLKVKSDLYVAAHRMRGETGLTLKKACELVLIGEQDEYLAYFPDDKENVGKVMKSLNDYLKLVEDVYGKYLHLLDKKEFALSIKDYNFKHLLFTMKRDNCSSEEAFHKMLDGSKLKTLMEIV